MSGATSQRPAACARVKAMIESYFPALWLPLEAVLATMLAMVPDDVVNPPTCILVGPSSSAKTTVLDLVGEIEDVTYRSDKFSPKAFVSHAANVKRAELEKIDLLPRLKHKTLVTPELAPLFRGNEDGLTETFAILTAVLDGHGYTSDSGTQGQRGYTGDDYVFAWLGATTPLSTHVWKVMAQLGSRLFFYAMPENTATEEELVEALTGPVAYRKKVGCCHALVCALLKARLAELRGGVRTVAWNRSADPPGVVKAISRWATLLAKLRGVVSVTQEHARDGEEFVSYSPPNVEAPHRAAAVLYNLARGRALLWGRQQLAGEDVALVKHVALSSAPAERGILLRALLETPAGLTTAAATATLKVTAPTARKFMRTLALLDIAELAGDDESGHRLTLARGWGWCREPVGDTEPFGFQGVGGESETEVCEPQEEVPL